MLVFVGNWFIVEINSRGRKAGAQVRRQVWRWTLLCAFLRAPEQASRAPSETWHLVHEVKGRNSACLPENYMKLRNCGGLCK